MVETTAARGPAPACEEWAAFAPGPELALRLADTDPATLPDDELIAMLGAARRQTSWTQSVELEAVAELSRRRGVAESGPVTAEATGRLVDEVSLALTVPPGAAWGLVQLARALADRLPETRSSLRAGRIDAARAAVICDGLFGTGDELAAQVERTVNAKATALTSAKLKRLVRSALLEADPAAARERTRTARRRRRVELSPNASGTGDLTGRDMDADEAGVIYGLLTSAAQAMKADGDVRTLDELRADLYAAVLRGTPLAEASRNLRTTPEERAESRPGVGPTGRAHGDTGGGDACAEETGDDDTGDDDISAAVERQIARGLARVADRHLRGVLARARRAGRTGGRVALITQAVQAMTDGLADARNQWCRTAGRFQEGGPVRHGHDGHRPPAALRRLVTQRHPTCVFPTCDRLSTAADVDHTEPYERGGVTCACNLSPLCRRHHRAKQHDRWTLHQPWPGLLIWVTPAGTWHIVTPE